MTKIGFIGLGIMGSRMVTNLLEAGREVVVLDTNPTSVQAMVDLGATMVQNAKDLASQVDRVHLSLPDSPQVEQVTFGDTGLVAGARPGLIVADHSSVAAATPQKISEAVKDQGIIWLDAPVSGGPAGAAAGTLTIMVGGDEDALREIQPTLEVIGRNIEYMGPSGMGAITKTINQMAIGVQMIALAEAFTLGNKAGISTKRLLEVLRTSTSRCWVMEELVTNVVAENDFENPRFSVRLISKDVRIASQTAKSLGVPAAATALAEQMFAIAEGNGWGSLDQMAVFNLYGKAVGIDTW
jgi:3-hydroxyisobutyrate dehydrogenase-like beta-hydroxyacid dehydrogenase